MLVERKYNELCRKRGVRMFDAERHKQFVMNAFFNEDVLEQVALTRKRVPKWLNWCLDTKENRGHVMAC